ncbi:MAG TPA: hypothetical protein GX745_00970 [Clostridiales bacterium]|nr:hypothetical protein [Clostridiales bacterium]
MIWVLIGFIFLVFIGLVIKLILIVRSKLIKKKENKYYKEQNRWLVEQFRRCNVAVFGKKGTGKDLLFAHVIYLRKECHYANIPYNELTEVIPLNIIGVGSNNYKNVLENNIKKIERTFKNCTDIYLSDAGIFFPSQYNETLDKLYAGIPIFMALSRQLYQLNVHFNSQELNRVWNKIREQADCYIRVLQSRFVGPFVYIDTISYQQYNSAEKGILPPLKPRNKKERRELEEFTARNGEVVYRTFRMHKREIKFDTYYFSKVFFDDEGVISND